MLLLPVTNLIWAVYLPNNGTGVHYIQRQGHFADNNGHEVRQDKEDLKAGFTLLHFIWSLGDGLNLDSNG